MREQALWTARRACTTPCIRDSLACMERERRASFKKCPDRAGAWGLPRARSSARSRSASGARPVRSLTRAAFGGVIHRGGHGR